MRIAQIVAVVEGLPTSIYDGTTVFPLGRTVFHQAEEDHKGGLYCYRTVGPIGWPQQPVCVRMCALWAGQ